MYFNIFMYILWTISSWMPSAKEAEARKDLEFSDENILVLKDVEVMCQNYIGIFGQLKMPQTEGMSPRFWRIFQMCKEGKVDVFEYNSKYSKICKDVDIYNLEPLKKKKGSYVVVHRRLFRDVSDRVNFNVDFECLGEPLIKKSQSLFELLQKADSGNYVSLNLVGKEYEAKYCWTIGKRLAKDQVVTLGRLKSLNPKNIKYKTTQCHINGSIQPDDYNDIFFPGDVVPASFRPTT